MGNPIVHFEIGCRAVTVYAEVDDIPACLEKAKGLGGSTMVPETEVPGQGRFAWLKDIDGNIIGLWGPA